jgi:hypothetical protein
LPKRTTVSLTTVPLTIRGFSGLESELGVVHLDLTDKRQATLPVPENV